MYYVLCCKNEIVKITILLVSTLAKNLTISCIVVQIIMYTHANAITNLCQL